MAKSDFLCVTGFVEHCLKQKPEQTDVVHDLLAFLAQRMIELNKQVLTETKGFLHWLEITIGAKVDALKKQDQTLRLSRREPRGTAGGSKGKPKDPQNQSC